MQAPALELERDLGLLPDLLRVLLRPVDLPELCRIFMTMRIFSAIMRKATRSQANDSELFPHSLQEGRHMTMWRSFFGIFLSRAIFEKAQNYLEVGFSGVFLSQPTDYWKAKLAALL